MKKAIKLLVTVDFYSQTVYKCGKNAFNVHCMLFKKSKWFMTACWQHDKIQEVPEGNSSIYAEKIGLMTIIKNDIL